MARRMKEFTPGRGYSREDWDEVGDPHEATDVQWAEAKTFVEMFPELGAWPDAAERVDVATEKISLRLDSDVLDAYRATGPGWQDRMNTVLRAAIRPRAKV